MITIKISNRLSEKIITYANKMIEKENDIIFKQAYSKKKTENKDPNDLIKITTNQKEEIISVDFNIKECETILFSIVEIITKELDGINEFGYAMFIPFGTLTENPLFVNSGPKIPIKIEVTDVALGNIKTKIREYGVNNCLVEIYFEILIKVNTVLPLEQDTKELKYEALIASKIIAGKVPNFYNGKMESKSDTINLPITE